MIPPLTGQKSMLKNLLIYLTHPHVGVWNLGSRHVVQFSDHLPQLQVDICQNSNEFKGRLPKADAVAVWFFKREWLDSAPRLKLIATPAAGTEWLDVEPKKGLDVLHGGFHGMMIAESVLGALFHFCKAFELSRQMQEKKKWAPRKISEKITSLHGARVTILGFGRIGRTLGRVLKPFGCRITGINRTTMDPPDYFRPEDRVVPADQLPEVLKTTDHLILILPGGPETEGLLTPDHFRSLPSHCFLYNVGRGNAYAEVDLVRALRERHLAGAYLDVFATEPLPETSPLWEMENVLIQPHLSAASPQYMDLFVDELITEIKSQIPL